VTRVANIVFNPFVNDSRVLKESISLSKAGYEIEVIGHLDNGLPKQEKHDDFIIKRFTYLDRTITKSKFTKLIVYLKYLKECISYCKDFDILHCNDLNTLPIGYIVKRFFNKKIKIVYDAHEYETEINGLTGIKRSITKYLERTLIKSVDKVITVSNAIAEEYIKLYDIEKPSLVLNTPPYQVINKKNIFREELDIDKEKTIFLYQGGFSKNRGIEILLDTFKEIEDENSVIVFMGYGELEEEIKYNTDKYNNIYFYPAVSPNVLLDYTSSADFGILFYENTCLNHYYCSPNKMFEYLMAEIPVIASNLFEMKRLVESNEIGIVAKDNTKEGLDKAIKDAIILEKSTLKHNIQKIKKVYNWEEQEKTLLNTYKDLTR